MTSIIDRVGEKVGTLLIKEYRGQIKNYSTWLCLCDCGKEVTRTYHSLVTSVKRNRIPSCGCVDNHHYGSRIDHVNEKHGRLLIKQYIRNDKVTSIWLCICDCGKEITARYGNLVSGNTKSCGCQNREVDHKAIWTDELRALQSDLMVSKTKAYWNRLTPEEKEQRLIQVRKAQVTGIPAAHAAVRALLPGEHSQRIKEGIEKWRDSISQEEYQELEDKRVAGWHKWWETNAWKNACVARPNTLEQCVQVFLDVVFPNEWKYNAGEFVIAGKVPDFVNINGLKAVIEIFGDYWHRDHDPQEKIDIYKSVGYDCVVIWESEFDKDPEGTVEKIFELKQRCGK